MPVVEMFQIDFMQRALLGGLLLGITCPLLGTFLVLRRLSLMGDGLGHLAFAGVGLGLFLGVNPTLTAAGTALLGALGIETVRQRQREAGDVALAVFFYTGIAAAAIFAGLAGQFNAGLLAFLFGSILTIAPGELALVAILTVFCLGFMGVAWRSLMAVALDEDIARTTGLPVRMLNLVLVVLTAFTVTLAMRIVGILLVAALLVIPVAVSLPLTRSFASMLRFAVGTSVLSVTVGLIASFWLDLPPGGTIVLVMVALFAAGQAWVRLKSTEPGMRTTWYNGR